MPHADETKDFSPAGAAKALEGLTAFEASLRQRTEGITWALWGLVTAAIFLSYGYAGAVTTSWPWWLTQLWAPWTAAGVAVTAAVWRSAALTAPRAAEGPTGWWHVVAWPTAIVGTFTVATLLIRQPNEQVLALAAVGLAGVLVGALNVLHYTSLGRRIAILGGVTMLAVAGVEAIIGVGYGAATVMSVATTATVWLGAGMYQTLRG